MSEIGAGIKELFASKETKLFNKEINSIRNIRETWLKYRDRFRQPPEETPVGDLYGLAREVGYEVKEVGIRTRFVGVHGNIQEITYENSCRIGKGNKLYVAVRQPGKPYDTFDLSHNVGACLLGGKIVKKGCVPYVRVDTFNQVTQLSQGITFTSEELDQKSLFTEDDNTRIPEIYIFDALLAGKLSYRDIRYFPSHK